MKRFVLLCIALFLTGTITGSCKKAAPPEAEPVKIGVILPLSGPAATYGIDAKSGIEFAIEQINEEGGIKSLGGARMKHVMVDDKTQAATGVSEFERLVTVEKVVACLGPMISAGMKAAFPYADRYKVPIFSGIGILVSKESYEYGRNMQVMPSDIGDFIIGGGASLMEEFNIPIEKVAHIAYDISAGPLQKRIIPKSATKYGLGDKLVLNELVSAKSDDLKPVALKVKASGAQMVLTGLPHKLIILWCKACYAVNYFPLISVGWSGTTDVAVWRGLGDKMAEETIGRPGWIGLAYWHKDLPYKPLQDFIKSYKEWVKKKELPE
ncbi:MAG: ABC transporter substrate-binding protein, partial [Thermodesulfobacteriota bacterium]|nr:ABC transporter substrate-binding protein [Thermodesulfobacteriota bacterium]